jgi:hypothetical protein
VPTQFSTMVDESTADSGGTGVSPVLPPVRDVHLREDVVMGIAFNDSPSDEVGHSLEGIEVLPD